MKLPWYVFSKGSFLDNFPLIGKSTAQSLGPIILVPQDVYRDLKSEIPNPKHVAILMHEETHRKRQKEIGYVKFAFLYLFNPKFRFQEELLAIKEAMKHLKKSHIRFDFDRKAKILSSYRYFWPVSEEYAKKELRKIWNEI